MPVQRIVNRLTLTLKVVNLQLAAGGEGFRNIAQRHAILRSRSARRGSLRRCSYPAPGYW
ncbi:hypothetical protein [Klebsiella pneumoniae IS53]|nr:hypothetical protein [Klebsiella pneumoniae IS53]